MKFLNTITFLSILALMAFQLTPKKKIKVFMAGDSTMSIKEVKAYPETGWGMPFVYFFDTTVKIDNRAKNGRSTRTFISEGLWDNLIKDVQAGDYVFIQFGHNDESPEKVERYTTPEQYKINIVRFITEAKAKRSKSCFIYPGFKKKV
jgi:lysophospholipase L1-like esterase